MGVLESRNVDQQSRLFCVLKNQAVFVFFRAHSRLLRSQSLLQIDLSSDYSGVEINFFINLSIGQVISNVYLPEENPTCPKQEGTIHLEVASL